MTVPARVIFAALMTLALAACAGDRADRGLGPSRASGLSAATKELKAAKAAGFSDTVEWGKAASLISAAKIQEQFGEYQNCVQKTRDARRFIAKIPRK